MNVRFSLAEGVPESDKKLNIILYFTLVCTLWSIIYLVIFKCFLLLSWIYAARNSSNFTINQQISSNVHFRVNSGHQIFNINNARQRAENTLYCVLITLRNPLLRGKNERWTEKNTLYRVFCHFSGPPSARENRTLTRKRTHYIEFLVTFRDHLLRGKNELWTKK